MGDSAYFANQLKLFSAAHPADQGWNIHEADHTLKQELESLPQFLTETIPQSIKKMEIVRTLVGNCKKTDGDIPGPDGLECESWIGEIEFEWEGNAIHCVCFMVLEGGRSRTNLLATKSFGTLESLWKGLRRYNRKHLKTDRIQVMRGDDIALPEASWADLFLPDGMAKEIRLAAESFFCAREKYENLGIAYRRGFLFTGPAGCGKTVTIKTIVSNCGIPCVAHVTRELSNDTICLGLAFHRAASQAPSILILEDLDKLEVDLSGMLNMLDGLETPQGVLVLATANNPEKLDPALLLRPSRFDRVWNFPLPAFEQRLQFLSRKGGGTFGNQALEAAAKGAQGFSMAYVQEILTTALMCAMNEGKEPSDEHLLKSLGILKKQIRTSQKAPGEIGKQADGVGFAAECQNA